MNDICQLCHKSSFALIKCPTVKLELCFKCHDLIKLKKGCEKMVEFNKRKMASKNDDEISWLKGYNQALTDKLKKGYKISKVIK